MNKQLTQKARLMRLGIPLALAWSIAWIIGIAILANVAVNQREEMRSADLDADLSLNAMAVYGLTWFDEDEQFHDEVLHLESNLLDAAMDIWIIEPADSDIIYLAPPNPNFKIDSFNYLKELVIQQEKNVFFDGIDNLGKAYRLHAIPTYPDQQAPTSPKAMIIVVADPMPGLANKQAFTNKIIWVTFILGGVGLLVGVLLALWSLRPALLSLHQRERFISATAHELRTPLAAIRSINESALHGDEPAEVALSRMQGILESASHTVDDLLLFARLDAGAKLGRQPVRLDLLVETLLPEDDSVALVAEESVVVVDTALIKVAVRNLIENARKHSGLADVTVYVDFQSIEVRDSGSGFPESLLQRVERDFVISPTQSGTGLGLAICNMIARLHGGQLSLSNNRKGGAIARLTFNS